MADKNKKKVPGVKKEKQKTLKIYTRTGDSGETSLCNGTRTFKDSLRVESYGSIDELNSFIGLCIIKLDQPDIKYHLTEIQKDLFCIGSNLAFPLSLSQSQINNIGNENSSMENQKKPQIPIIKEEMVKRLENWIDKYDKELPVLKNFILSGGNEASSLLHTARAVCRRAERRIVSLKRHEEIDKNILKYINRLSDYLFTAARLASHRKGKEDIKWKANS